MRMFDKIYFEIKKMMSLLYYLAVFLDSETTFIIGVIANAFQVQLHVFL